MVTAYAARVIVQRAAARMAQTPHRLFSDAESAYPDREDG
jgi:hypothetical protein